MPQMGCGVVEPISQAGYYFSPMGLEMDASFPFGKKMIYIGLIF